MTAPSAPGARENLARLRIVETARIERTDVGFRRLGREAQDEFQMRIGREGAAAGGRDEADVDAFVDFLEETGQRVGPWINLGGVVSRGTLRGHRPRLYAPQVNAGIARTDTASEAPWTAGRPAPVRWNQALISRPRAG